jgi:hypothetical protein
MPILPLSCNECRLINYQLWMSDPTLDDVQPYYGINLREIGPPLVKTASRSMTPIESQWDTHDPIGPTGGFADREIPPALCGCSPGKGNQN